MKTIFTTLAIATSTIFFAQQSAPSVEWTRDYKINSTRASNLTLDNNNVFAFLANDYDVSTQTSKLHLVKLNAGGVVSDVVLSVPTESYYPWKLVATSDNNFVTTNENDGSLQKYNANGGLVWNKSFGNDFYTSDFIKTTDNNLIVVGAEWDEASDAILFYLIRKMDNSGNTIWEKKIEKLNNMFYVPTAITQTSAGGYIVGGVYTDIVDVEYFLGYNLVKLDANGNVTWEKRYAVQPNTEVWPEKILLSDDGGFIMLSELDDDNPGSNTNSQYGKFDSSGNLIWNRPTADYISNIQKGLDNGYVLSTVEYGNTSDLDKFLLRKINDSGNLVWEKNYGTLGDSSSESLVRISDGFAVLSTIYGTQTNSARITKFGTAIVGTSDIAKQNITLYPNPTVDFLNLKIDNVKSIDKIEIYDFSGRMVKSIANSNTTNIDVKDLKKGSYVVKVKSGNLSFDSKFIKK